MPTINRSGADIYYEVSGAGPAVVFAHSFFCDRTFFKHQVAALQGSHRLQGS